MDKDKDLFFLSGFLSFFLYFFFIFLILNTAQKKKNTNSYGFKQKTIYEIELVENNKFNKIKSKRVVDKHKSKSIIKKTFKKDGTTSKVDGAKLKSLFAKAAKSSKKVSEDYVKSKNKDLASRKYGQGRVKEQSINDLFNDVQKINITNNSLNKYDEYYSKVVRIMTNEWNSYIKMRGNHQAEVLRKIANSGILSFYKIKKLSSNLKFNTSLKYFLKYLAQKQFPISLDGKNRNEIEVIFKIKE